MCGFQVYTKRDISKKEFLEGFSKIKYRGPDMSRIKEYDFGIFGFHRLIYYGGK